MTEGDWKVTEGLIVASKGSEGTLCLVFVLPVPGVSLHLFRPSMNTPMEGDLVDFKLSSA